MDTNQDGSFRDITRVQITSGGNNAETQGQVNERLLLGWVLLLVCQDGNRLTFVLGWPRSDEHQQPDDELSRHIPDL